MEDTTTPPSGISRSGLILGAAGVVGAAALAGLPGTADAFGSGGNGGNGGAGSSIGGAGRTRFRDVEFTIKPHPAYNRRHFDRANAIAVVHNPVDGTSMTLQVEDLVALRHTAEAKAGSDAWSAGFSSLLSLQKGTALPSGTYPTTINGRTFPLTIARVGERTYQVTVDRRTPKKGARHGV